MQSKKLILGKVETESSIQTAICQYLSLRKWLFWRNNNTPIFDPTRQLFRAMPRFTMKGIPDIIVIDGGHFIGLEVKRKGTYQSPDQKEFEKLCTKHGASYHVVRSVDDVQKIGL